MHAHFSADLFRIAMLAASDEQTRFYLNGVSIERHHLGGVLMVATDGHRLICLHDVTGDTDATGIVRLTPEALKLCKSKRGETRDINICGDHATIMLKHENETVWNSIGLSNNVLIDASYPDWRRVLPAGPFTDNKVRDTYNALLLATFATIGKELADLRGADRKKTVNTAMRIIAAEEGKPALIRWFSADNAFGVLMPMTLPNGYTLDDTYPLWLGNSQKPSAIAA